MKNYAIFLVAVLKMSCLLAHDNHEQNETIMKTLQMHLNEMDEEGAKHFGQEEWERIKEDSYFWANVGTDLINIMITVCAGHPSKLVAFFQGLTSSWGLSSLMSKFIKNLKPNSPDPFKEQNTFINISYYWPQTIAWFAVIANILGPLPDQMYEEYYCMFEYVGGVFVGTKCFLYALEITHRLYQQYCYSKE